MKIIIKKIASYHIALSLSLSVMAKGRWWFFGILRANVELE